jgi:hypothetical protein
LAKCLKAETMTVAFLFFPEEQADHISTYFTTSATRRSSYDGRTRS